MLFIFSEVCFHVTILSEAFALSSKVSSVAGKKHTQRIELSVGVQIMGRRNAHVKALFQCSRHEWKNQ